MAVIGSWGDITFAVSRNKVKTFDDLKWDSGAQYTTHNRHLKEPLLEFTGPDAESMTFSMFFSVFLGVNPITEVAKLLQAMRRGEVNRLVIGAKAYGTNKWVITKLSNALKRYDNRGNLLVAEVSVTMKSYAAR
jgi:phage protein U